MTTQEPSVLLVELSEKSAGFSQALSQVGRASVALTLAQLEPALTQGSPLCIVAKAEHVSQIMEQMRAAGFPAGLPFFVLTRETPGSTRPPLPDVTACVPEGIDPGILVLRIQQALQLGGPRARQPTVLGLGSMSRPQALPSKPPATPLAVSVPVSTSASASAAAPSARPVVPPSVRPATAPSASSPSTRPVVPPSSSLAPEVPWDTSSDDVSAKVVSQKVVSSLPALNAGTSGQGSTAPPSPPKQSSGVVSSAPPLPDISARAETPTFELPSTAPLPGDFGRAPLSSPPLSTAPRAPSGPPAPPAAPSGPPVSADPMQSAAPAVPTHPPVAFNTPPASAFGPPLDLDEDFGQKKSPWVKRGLVGAAAIAAVVGGSMFVFGEKGEVAADASTAAGDSPQSGDAAQAGVAAPPAGDGSKAEPAEAEKAAAPAEPQDEETVLFKISSPAKLPSCEKVLGKSAGDFATAKKWRATQVWKQARQSLLAGNEEKALQYMCEAAFIDAAGPATVGLSKYYLGKRAIDEAHAWAERALKAAPGAASKRTAQQALGDVLSQMGKMDEARAAWLDSFNLKAEQKDRLAPVCRNFVSAALKSRKGGDSESAEQLLRRAAAFTPEDATTAALLASTLLDNEQPELAKRWAERSLKLKPGHEMAQEVLAKLGS